MDWSCLHSPAGWNLCLRVYKTLHINPSISLINKRVPWHYSNRHDNTSSHRSKIILKGTTHLQNTSLWFNRERENRRELSTKTTFNQRVFRRGRRSKLSFSITGKINYKEGKRVSQCHPPGQSLDLDGSPSLLTLHWGPLLSGPPFGFPDPYAVLSARCFGRQREGGRGSERNIPLLLRFLKRRLNRSNDFGKFPLKGSQITTHWTGFDVCEQPTPCEKAVILQTVWDSFRREGTWKLSRKAHGLAQGRET